MSFRAIYIIDPRVTVNKSKRVVFKRVFPVIERQCAKSVGVERYRGIPQDYTTLILEQLQLLRNKDEFIAKFDSCAQECTSPVYKLLDGALYPVVAFQKAGFVFTCIVWDGESMLGKNKPLVDSPAVIFALTMLENMANIINKNQTISESQLELLHQYVSIGFPFGIPTELNLSTVTAMASTAVGIALPKIKGPAWRPTAYKGKQNLHLTINESVRGIQFDHAEIRNRCEVYGTIMCKADVEQSPEITVNFSSPADVKVLQQMAYHPSVQYIDDIPAVMKSIESKPDSCVEYATQKVRFSPPLTEFVLCHYKADVVEEFPVTAFYQMKGTSRSVNIMIQLDLSHKMKNDFEAFDVHIPFFNRGPILDITCLTSSANVYVLSDKATLLWSIGTKFATKSKDLSLDVEVTFGDDTGGVVKPHKFLHGLSSYIWITWKMNDFTYSGLKFDSKSVEVYPSSRIKVHSASLFKTVEFKVWNSHGDVTDTTFSS